MENAAVQLHSSEMNALPPSALLDKAPAQPAPLPRRVAGLHELELAYDGFLIDQWGVLHDGKQAYAGAADCLRALRARGKRVIVLSNSGKRAAPNALRMAHLGFPADTYDALITSGEAAWSALSEPRAANFRHWGSRCLLLTSDADTSSIDGLAVTRVHQPEDADFVLLSGIEDVATLTQYMPLLARALARGLPLLCTNPDRIRLSRDGTAPAVGALAHEYERMGGQVRYIGKPHPDIYDIARRQFHDLSAARILCIGDSMQHDVRGGQEAGFDTLFVLQGIFRDRFPAGQAPHGEGATELHAIQTLAREFDAWPDWYLDTLQW